MTNLNIIFLVRHEKIWIWQISYHVGRNFECYNEQMNKQMSVIMKEQPSSILTQKDGLIKVTQPWHKFSHSHQKLHFFLKNILKQKVKKYLRIVSFVQHTKMTGRFLEQSMQTQQKYLELFSFFSSGRKPNLTKSEIAGTGLSTGFHWQPVL